MTTVNLQDRNAEKVGRYEISTHPVGTEGRVYVHITSGNRYSPKSGTCRSAEHAASFIQEFRNAEAKKIAARDQKQAANRTARESFVNPYKVGDLFAYSWGYDQTQVEFAQAVAVGPRSITLREIGGEEIEGTQGHDCASYRPVKDKFAADSQPKRITIQVKTSYDGKTYSYIPAEHGHWNLTSEQGKHYSSWYR